MISPIEKDKKKRLQVATYEFERLQLKALITDLKLPSELRRQALQRLSRLPRNSSYVRTRKRCVITGRSRGVVSDFKMSRTFFRDYALFGLLPGVKKSSW